MSKINIDKALVRVMAMEPTQPNSIGHITVITALVGLGLLQKAPTPEGPWHVKLTDAGRDKALHALMKIGRCPECDAAWLSPCMDKKELVGIGCSDCGGMFEPVALAKSRKVRKIPNPHPYRPSIPWNTLDAEASRE